jgi:hypothetical protein
VLAGALGGCGDEGGDDAVLAASAAAEVDGEASWVQLPGGRVDFRVRPPAPLEEEEVSDADRLDPDSSYVGVTWQYSPGEGIPPGLGGFFVESEVSAPVSVVVGGTRHDVGTAYSLPGDEATPDAVYVKVPDDVSLDDVELRVEFAGVSQSVTADGSSRDAGRAAAMYELAEASSPARCRPALEPASVSGNPRCAVASVQLPYLTGEGWAPEGAVWTVVDVSTRLAEVRQAGDATSVVGLSGAATLDGDPPEAVLLEDGGFEGTLHTQAGYLTRPGDPLVLDLRHAVDLGAGGPADVVLRSTVRLDA